MTTQAIQTGCTWCSMPKGKQGILLGVVASLALHFAFVGGVRLLSGDEKVVAKSPRPVIDAGTFAIRAYHRPPSANPGQGY